MGTRYVSGRAKVTARARNDLLWSYSAGGALSLLAMPVPPLLGFWLSGCGAFLVGAMGSAILLVVAVVLFIAAFRRHIRCCFCGSAVPVSVESRIGRCRLCDQVHAIKWE